MEIKKESFILFSDLHIHLHNVEAVLNVVDQIIDICKKYKSDLAICLGDVFDSRKAQPLQSLKVFEQILIKFEKAKITLICIPGNHDKVNYESYDSYLDQYKHWPCLELFDRYHYISGPKVKYHFLPFFDEETYISLYKSHLLLTAEAFNADKNYLFTHIGVNTAFNNEGQKISSYIMPSLFKNFDKVFTGHYHNQSKVGNIYYIGSIMPNNFGEDNEKGCTVLFEDGSHEFIKLSFPKYEKIVIDIDQFNKEKEQELLQKYSNSKDYIRFEFIGDSSKINSLDKTKFEIVGIDVKTKNKEIEAVINISEFDEFVEFTRDSLVDEFQKFCEINDINDSELGLEYLNKHLYGKHE